MIKINGVLVLYNPEENFLLNIYSYINEIDKLYVVDNSENKNLELIEKIEKIDKCHYIDNQGNKGIAHALNVGAKSAIDDGATWLLTMDQDSSFSQGSLNKLIEWIGSNNTDNIGIVSPMHSKNELLIDINKNYITMTSGNLVNLMIFSKIGNFLEKLFIDSVDTEYCLRLKKFNYKIQRLSSVVLNHNLGNMKYYIFFNKKIAFTNHNYIRRYYMMRNRLYIWKEYSDVLPSFIERDKQQAIKEIFKVILFENAKFKKLFFTLKGYVDYKKSKFGKIDE